MAYIGLCVRRVRSASLTAVLCGALAMSALAAVTPDSAYAQTPGGLRDESPQDRPQMVSVFTGFLVDSFLSYGFPLVVGGRYYFPIVPNGFIPSLNDEFGLEGGLDLLFLFGNDTFFGFGIPVDALWDFHFTPSFDAYFKVGFEIGTLFSSRNSVGGFWWDFRPSVGMRLRLNDALYFRVEAGYPSIMAGLGFAF
jgi:hypothetical protein